MTAVSVVIVLCEMTLFAGGRAALQRVLSPRWS